MRLNKTKQLPVVLAVNTVLVVIAIAFMVHSHQMANLTKLSPTKANLIWERSYGGTADDRAFTLTAAEDGYLVAGSSQSQVAGRTVGWILRLDQNGDILWNRTFPADGNGEVRHALNLSDGFLLVCNLFLPNGDIDGFLLRINMEGNLVWNLTLAGAKVDKLFSAVSTSDGFVVAGLTYSFGGGDSDAWIVKVDLGGNLVWERTYGEGAEEAARAIAIVEGGYAVAGYSNHRGSGNYDILLLKLDTSGNVVWKSSHGGDESEKAYAITAVEDKLFVAGDTRSTGMGDSDAWIIEVDEDSNLIWQKTVGGVDFDMPTCIIPSKDGGLLVGGYTFSFGSGKRDFWLFKLDCSGELSWSLTQGKNFYEEAYAVVEVAENEFVMAGWENYAEGGQYDYYVAKISQVNANEWACDSLVGWFLSVAVIALAAVFLTVYKLRNQQITKS